MVRVRPINNGNLSTSIIPCIRKRAQPGNFVKMFRLRYLCKCLAFLIAFLPIIDVYAQFATSSLMYKSAINSTVLGNLDSMYDKENDSFILCQMGMRNMCLECYCFLNGLSVHQLQRLMAKYRKHETASVTRKPGSGRKVSLSTVDCELWFRDLIATMGEPAPDSNKIFLPPATKADFFKQYKQDRAKSKFKPISRTSFYDLWASKFPHLKVICIRNLFPFQVVTTPRLGKCVFCLKYRAMLDAEKDPQVGLFRELTDAH